MAPYPLWLDTDRPCPYAVETDATAALLPTWYHSWDAILKPRYLLIGPRFENHRSIVNAEVYLPQMLARQLGCP